jgi:pimeloyl-ACP methyl ester carboxylesterase
MRRMRNVSLYGPAELATPNRPSAQILVLDEFCRVFGRRLRHHSRPFDSRVILIASIVPYMFKTSDNPKGVESSVFDGMALALQADRAKFWGAFFKDFYGAGLRSNPVSDEVIAWSQALAMKASLKATLDCANSFATTDFRKDLKAFKVPTLVIHGTDDKIVPIDTSGRAAAAGISGSKLIEYQGGPHGLLATHKTRIAEDVLKFLG